MITYKLWRDPLHDIQANPEESGWDRERMRACWAFLDATSRSFAAVIKELKGELSRVICIFYLVLRGLDTVEDDMTIKPEVKIPLLIDFYKKLNEPGWNFTESGPNEKDRQLLVEFDKVIAEYQLLNEGCRMVMSDICARMGAGMASYIEMGSSPAGLRMQTWKDYDLYCHFVAGLVGEGLSGLFVETNIERPLVALQLSLSNHMGLFLQKTNIIRDYAEDCHEGRSFWPMECWGKNGVFERQVDVQLGVEETSPGSGTYRFADTREGKEAQAVLSSMLLDALSHATRSLDYLVLLHDQSVFNFCATPQVMAIATLDKLMNNADVYKKNVKIRKSLAVRLILFAVNPRDVSFTFLEFARSMHTKLSPSDPNYLRWCLELGRIETWCQSHFPSYVQLSTKKTSIDVRALMFKDFVSMREREIRLRQANATPEMLKVPQQELDRRSPEYWHVLTLLAAMVMIITTLLALTAYAFWMVSWYVMKEGPDPLSRFFYHCYAMGRAKYEQHAFSWNVFRNMQVVHAVVHEAGSIVARDLERM